MESFLQKIISKEGNAKKLGLSSAPRLTLKAFGMWPTNYNTYSMIKHLVYTVLWLCPFVITAVFHFIHVINTSPFDFTKCAFDVAVLLSGSTAEYFEVLFIVYHKEIVEILNELSSSIDQVADIRVVDNILNFLANFYLVFVCCIGFLSFLSKLVEECEPGDDSTCGLIITARFPGINLTIMPYKQIMLTVQAIFCYAASIIAYYLMWTILSEAEFLCSLLRHLKQDLLRIHSLKDRPARKRHIRKCVIYHHSIIRLWEKYIKATSFIYFPLVMQSAVIMSLCAFVLLLDFQFSMLLHFFMWWSNALVCCLFGERLHKEIGCVLISQTLYWNVIRYSMILMSISVVDVAYSCIPWDGDCETARDLLLIMIRSGKPLYIVAGKFAFLNHLHFMQLMKTTYSFFTLIINVL